MVVLFTRLEHARRRKLESESNTGSDLQLAITLEVRGMCRRDKTKLSEGGCLNLWLCSTVLSMTNKETMEACWGMENQNWFYFLDLSSCPLTFSRSW